MSLKAALFATVLSLTALPAMAFGPQEFTAREVSVDSVVGWLNVVVDPGVSKVTASVSGPARWADSVTVRLDRDDLVITQKDAPRERHWRTRDDWVTVELRVPVGTALDVDDFSGEGKVGDLRGPLSVGDMTAGKLTVGHVTAAAISIAGSGDVIVGDIDKAVDLEIDGSGSINTGRTGGPVDLEINGSGQIDIAAINGAVNAEVNGSGDIKIRSGVADPLAVEINGSGSLLLDGISRNQNIRQSGSGTVRITGKQG